jgi:ferritin-like metal-binding protein YciE
MPLKVSNRRDLLVLLLGELLFVERRLSGDVLAELGGSVQDPELQGLLKQHLDETRQHVKRLETAFRLIGVAPTSNLSLPFEAAIKQHDERSSTFTDIRLAGFFHAQTALQTEHWELAAYRSVFALAPDDLRDALRPSYDEEGEMAKLLVAVVDRLGVPCRLRGPSGR